MGIKMTVERRTSAGVRICETSTVPWWRRQRSDRDEPSGDEVVPLVQVPAFEAEIIVAKLRASGIHAAVFGPGSAGENSAILYAEGASVMVHRRDLDAAAVALESYEH
jgi:hypothetical protein